MTELERLAYEVAILAPLRRSKYSYEARISWAVVDAIRAELEKRGNDWRATAKNLNAILEQRRAERRAEHDQRTIPHRD